MCGDVRQHPYYELPNSNFVYWRPGDALMFNAWVKGTVRYEVRFSNFAVDPRLSALDSPQLALGRYGVSIGVTNLVHFAMVDDCLVPI